MAKVTSKLQVTLPKALAHRYGIHPGDEISWESAGDVIRVVPASRAALPKDVRARLALFDESTRRQRRRCRATPAKQGGARGWTRAGLYERARAR